MNTDARAAVRTLALVLLLAAPSAVVAAPTTLAVQGALRTSTGGPVSDGKYGIAISLYATKDAKTPLYVDKFLGVVVKGARFAVILGTSDAAKPLDDALFVQGKARWLGAAVSGDAELGRVPLGTLPYAHRATLAANALGLSCTGCVQASHIKAGSIGAAHLGAKAVGAAQLADKAVGAGHIAAKAIGAAHIGGQAIEPGHIANGTIAKLGYVKGAHYTDDKAVAAVVGSGKVAVVAKDGSVTAKAFVGDGSKLTGVATKIPNIRDIVTLDGNAATQLVKGQSFSILGRDFGKAPTVLLHNSKLKITGSMAPTKITTSIEGVVDTPTVAISIRDDNTGMRSNAVVLPYSPFAGAGTGADGPLSVGSGSKVVNSYHALKSTASKGAKSVTLTSTTGLSDGDEVLLLQVTGSGAGTYAWRRIKVKGDVISFDKALGAAFTIGGTSRAQAVRVPNYTHVQIGSKGAVIAKVWDGKTGGVVALRASGTVRVEGSIAANAAGLRGGAGIQHTGSRTRGGRRGEGHDGNYNATANGQSAGAGGGGGKTVNSDYNGPGGGGGGHGTAGKKGESHGNHPGGGGGVAYGDKTLAKLYFGAGGGSGAITNEDGKNYTSGRGGGGGGLVYIAARAIVVAGGCVRANGEAGANGPKGSADDEYGGGGGGAGGSVLLRALSVNLGSNGANVTAAGGKGGKGVVNNNYNHSGDPNDGGAGGSGRIRVDADAISGSSTPGYHGGAL